LSQIFSVINDNNYVQLSARIGYHDCIVSMVDQ